MNWIQDARFQGVVPVLQSMDGLGKLQLSPQEGFILSRVDGHSTVDEICLMAGLAKDETLSALAKLQGEGVIEIPGAPAAAADPDPTPDPAAAEPAPVDVEIPPFELDSESELSEAKQQSVHEAYHQLDALDFYTLLSLHPGCGAKDVQRAYRKISLKYHPDRFYGKKLGSYKGKLESIFRHLTNVAEYLTDDEQRASYEEETVLPARSAAARPAPVAQPTPPEQPAKQTGQAAPRTNPGSTPTTKEREAVHRARKLTREERLRRLGGVLGMSTQELKAVARKKKTSTNEVPAISRERKERMAKERRSATRQAVSPLLQRKQKAKMHFEEGIKAMLAAKWAAAASNLKLATTFDPKNAEYREKEQIASARAREDSAKSYAKRASFEEGVGRWEEAARLYKMAAERNPTVEHLYLAADALVKCGELKVAVEYATRSKDLNPNSVPARLSLANAYLAADMPKNARREVEYALKLDSDNRVAKTLLKEIRRKD